MFGFSSRRAALLAVAITGCSGRPPTTVAIPGPPAASAPLATAPGGPAEPSSREPEPADALAVEEAASDAPQDPEARAWLGVELEPAGLGEAGVRIVRIVPRSPAEKAGLTPGDVIVRLQNQPVSMPRDVVSIVMSQTAGTRVGVVLKRGGADRIVAVTLGAYPERETLYRMSFVDQPAPAFDSLSTVKGSLAPTLMAQRGQVVIVEFWAAWCTACRALIPHMNQWHAQYAARGVRVIGITTDSVPRAAAAAAELGMDYSILSDSTQRTTRAYQANAIPALFVIDRVGTVRDVVIGYDAPRLAKLDALVQRLVAER